MNHNDVSQPSPPMPAAPAQRKSWFARHKFLTAVLAVLAFVVLVNVLGDGDDDAARDRGGPAATVGADTDGGDVEEDGSTPETDRAEPADDEQTDDARQPEPEDDGAPSIGEAVLDGKFEFTVTEVETGVEQVGDDFLNEQAQGQFVLVHMTVRNVGDRAQMLDGGNQTLVDDDGREHSANTAAAIYLGDAETFLTRINPGNSVDGIVVFDIPADAEPAAITLHDSMFSGGVTVSLTD